MSGGVKRVLIIGSSGGFGELLARQFAGDDCVVSGIDLVGRASSNEYLSRFLADDVTKLNDAARELVHESDWIVMAIPEAQALSSLARLAEAARPGALLADILSVKTRIVEAAKNCCDAREYVSIHPLFGPQQGNFQGNITVVPVKTGAESRELLDTLRRWGGRVSEMSADDHDRMMAIVQVVAHAAILCFGATTSGANVNPEKLRATSTPVHSGLAALLARMTAGDPALYWDIQKNNPHAAVARDELARRLEQFRLIIDRGDFGAFAALYDEAGRAFPQLQTGG
jgi:prephenate dehydrogenase